MNATSFTAMKQAWGQVEAHGARLAKTSLVDLFAADTGRASSLTLNAPHVLADFSKQRIDAAAVASLETFAQAVQFDEWRAKLFAGDIGRFEEHSATWPDDVREHAALLAADAFHH